MTDPRLISADELRTAGALDVPAAWRKSLGPDRKPERDLFSDLPFSELTEQDDATTADQNSEAEKD